MVLGGDGTILRALQRYAGTGVPVFAINFGEIGFLATVEPQDDRGRHRARPRRTTSSCCACPRSCSTLTPPAIDRQARSTTSRSTARSASASPSSPTRSTARRSAACAATGSSSHAGRIDRLQPRQRRPRDGVGRGGLRRLLHRAALADRARARGRARRPADDPQPLARAARPRRRRAPGRARSPPADGSRRASSTTSARSRSCPARPSTAGCARSSGASPAERVRAQATSRVRRCSTVGATLGGRRCAASRRRTRPAASREKRR